MKQERKTRRAVDNFHNSQAKEFETLNPFLPYFFIHPPQMCPTMNWKAGRGTRKGLKPYQPLGRQSESFSLLKQVSGTEGIPCDFQHNSSLSLKKNMERSRNCGEFHKAINSHLVLLYTSYPLPPL